MPIPDFQTLMLPLLDFAGDRIEHSFKEVIPFLANKFKLTVEETRELLPSGKFRFSHQVYWTKTHLFKAGLLDSASRGTFKITDEGLKVLAARPISIDTEFLARYEQYCQFRTRFSGREIPSYSEVVRKETPEEVIENAYRKLQDALSVKVLAAIRQCSPYFFESLVIDLLISTGYGGSRTKVGQALQRSHGEGIIGIIKEDRLGLDMIYIQAKRWENNVSRPEIQKFAAALLGQSARTGIFITTSDFSQEALDYVTRIDSKIILIDGSRLTELAIEHNVGVTPILKYEVKKVDFDYFVKD